MRRRSGVHQFALLIALCSSLLVLKEGYAQRTLASLEITVQDPTGAIMPNAQLQLLNVETRVTRQGATNANGLFSFIGIEPGRYEVTVTAPGMETRKHTGIVVTTGIVNQVVVQMRVGQVTESVTVTAGAQMVNTVDGAVSGLVNADQVASLPLNVRNVASLVRLEPMVVPPDGISTSEGGSGNTNTGGFVGGQRSWDTGYTVDGGNIVSPSWPQPVWIVSTNGGISLDAVREFRIFTSNKPADAGGKSGAYVAITTKSGSDTFHGSALEYLRNTVLNTKAFFDLKRMPYQQNQFGGSLGGPLWKKKGAYFFGNYEGFRSKQPQSFNLGTPTPKLLAALPGGAAHGYLKELFAASYPAPLPGYDPNALVATARGTFNTGNTRDMGLGRLDWYLPHQNQLTLRYMQINGYSGFGAVWRGVQGGNVNQVWTGNNALIRLTTTISHSMVNEIHVDFDRNVTNFAAEPPPQSLVALGFSTSATSPKGMPTIDINGTGLQELGPPSWLPVVRYENSFEFADSFNWVHGKHSTSFGAQALRFQDNAVAVGTLRPATIFQGFGPPFDSSPNGVTTGIFLSQSQNLLQGGDEGERGYRLTEIAVFGHDIYRVASHLTLDLGLRWTYDTPFSEVSGRLNNLYVADASGHPIADAPVTLSNVQSVVLAQPSVAGIGYTKRTWNHFAPNVGVNWDVSGSGKTVLSSGYSVAYERQPMYYLATSAVNVPFVTSTVIQNLPFGTVAAPGTAGAGKPGLNTWNPGEVLPYVQYWNFSVQQALGKNGVTQISYIGNAGRHLFSDLQLNKGMSYAGSRPNPNYSTIVQTGADAISNYHGLAAQWRQQYGSGLFMQLAYTYSKSLDTASASNALANGNLGDFPVEENSERRGEYGPSGFDLRHVFAGNVVYKLPFGKGGTIYQCSGGIPCTVISGWQASTIFSVHSGGRFSLLSGSDNNGDGVVNDRAFQIASSISSLYDRTGLPKTQFLNPSAKNTVIATTGTYPLGRNAFSGPGFTDFDVELRKVTTVREPLKLTFIAQAFNVANHTNFGTPVGTVSSATFGQLQRTVSDPRVIQFSLRLDF